MSKDDVKIISILKKFKIYGLTRRLIYLKEKGIKTAIVGKKEVNKTFNSDCNFVTMKINEVLLIYDDKNYFKNSRVFDEIKSISKKYNFNFKILKLVNSYTKNDLKNNCISIKDLINQFHYKSFIYFTKKPKFDTSKLYSCFLIKNYYELEETLKSVKGLTLFSNYCNENNVSVRTTTFFDMKGTNYYSGGAERYLLDLQETLEEMKINMDVYQDAKIPFFRKYKNLNVIGLPMNGKENDWSDEFLEKRNNNYIYTVKPYNQLHVYSAFQECYPKALSPSIGISHGVSWDNEANCWTGGLNFEIEKNIMIVGADACDKLVSVDTNTCNWFQTIDYNLGAHKFSLVSNYVDTDEFYPRKDYDKKRDKIVITYPRRLYGARGLYVMLDITDKLVKKHDNIEIHFVGKGFKKDMDAVMKKVKKYPGKVFCYSKNPSDMYEVYRNTDISVIPTMFSEGTSLSCLEAMASGNMVIATRIGGLTDLVVNKYNGYLVEPNKESLFDAIDDAIINYEKTIQMKRNARNMALTFNKKEWKNKWKKIFNTFNLKTNNSKNIELVEFILNDDNSLSNKVIDLIKKELQENKLVYIRIKNISKNDKYLSSQRLQFIPYEEEDVAFEHKRYIDKKLKSKILVNKEDTII